jgi:hypothetical protein
MGQQISGIFLVKGSKKMEAIHCKFNSKGRNEKLYDFSILFIFYSLYNIVTGKEVNTLGWKERPEAV